MPHAPNLTPARACRVLLAALAPLAMLGCATITGENVQTELLVANHTPESVRVAFAQSPENHPTGAIALERTLRAGETVRFSGKEGDTLEVHVPGEPATTLVFAKRSQVIKVAPEGRGVVYRVRQGYTDPDRRD
jgi:hypothetical protein